MLAFPLFMISR